MCHVDDVKTFKLPNEERFTLEHIEIETKLQVAKPSQGSTRHKLRVQAQKKTKRFGLQIARTRVSTDEEACHPCLYSILWLILAYWPPHYV